MTAIPYDQRPRERLFAHGVDVMADAELLAVLLGTGHRGHSALAVAHDLLATFGGAQALARAHPDELSRRAGIGATKAARIAAAFGLAGRLRSRPSSRVVVGLAEVAELVAPMLAHARRERVGVVVCDPARRLRRVVLLTQGSQDECLAPVPEILTAVLLADGAAFAVAHNHPSGDLRPSSADRALTEALTVAADQVRLTFLGHVVVSGPHWASVPGPSP